MHSVHDVMADGDFAYVLKADGTAKIVGYFGGTENLVIPDRLDGHFVTTLGDGVISDVASMVREHTSYNAPLMAGTALKSVHIPASVVHVGMNPFRDCVQLQKITVAAENPALTVVEGALCRTEEKLIVCYPRARAEVMFTCTEGRTTIGAHAFECSGLTSIILPDSGTEIGEHAFSECLNLLNITIPDAVGDCADNLTIERDSAAVDYCKKNGIRYVCSDYPDWLFE